MPQHPNAPRPTPRPGPWNGHPPGPRPVPPGSRWPAPHGDNLPPTRRTGRDETVTVTASTDPEQKKVDLTVNKVLAGAGAAATTAVFGSYFGAAGTVAGAALGSMASTVATTIYQHSLDRTRDTLVARVRVRRDGEPDGSERTVLLPRPGFDDGDRAGPGPAGRPRRRGWLLAIGVTLVVFVVAMAVVTGIELAKGSTLNGNDSGTSVGRVVAPPPAAAPAEESTDEPTTTSEPTAEPADPQDATPTAEPTRDPEPPAGRGGKPQPQHRGRAGQPARRRADRDRGAGAHPGWRVGLTVSGSRRHPRPPPAGAVGGPGSARPAPRPALG